MTDSDQVQAESQGQRVIDALRALGVPDDRLPQINRPIHEGHARVAAFLESLVTPPDDYVENHPVWSNLTINGVRQTWRDLYAREHSDRQRGDRALVLLSDLDRCVHGRHHHDGCGSCGGPSRGNPHARPGEPVGYDLAGRPYVWPDWDTPADWHDLDLWGAQ